MSDPQIMMPNGKSFEYWTDETAYTKTYHVACEHPDAGDDNDGSAHRPFATISRAAELLQPGEKVIVHEGVYRECVQPARGGEGADRMIAYEAAEGEKVVIKGSRLWEAQFEPSAGYGVFEGKDGPRVWMGDLPREFFAGYNPFVARNINMHYVTYSPDDCWSKEETERFLLRRGIVFVDGQRLRQVLHVEELADMPGAFWVEEPGLRIHFRLQDDADPSGRCVEVTTQEQVFSPEKRGLGYIRLSGFAVEHCGDNMPVPQRAMVSPNRGHHWIIENNTIRWANAIGIDLGTQDFNSADLSPCGGHVVRGNTITDCGFCGIAGCGCVDGTLVEGNVIERIGWQELEHILECGGLKFHCAENVLIRRNVFRHIHDGMGVWLDVRNVNCRITGNVFADIVTVRGGVYIECSHDPNMVDGNVFWDIRTRTPERRLRKMQQGAYGFRADCPENITVAHNLFVKIPNGWAVSMNLLQADRVISNKEGPSGRVGVCRNNKVFNNIIADCPDRMVFGRIDPAVSTGNDSDGNLFDAANDRGSLRVSYPLPAALMDLAGWQEVFGLDRNSTQGALKVDFDPDELKLSVRCEGKLPACAVVDMLHDDADRYRGPGPKAEGNLWKSLQYPS